ncbi:MAG: pilus assembly PilX N-terminal domain-containing protein [Mycobacterium sp.]
MRLNDERGFTMITTILALFTISILSVAAIAAANGDIGLARKDQDDKQAYAAAEAGINDYLAHLDQDSNHWAQCTGPAGNPFPGINQQFTGTPPAGRKWRDVPGTTASKYSIELIPRRTVQPPETSAPTSCDTANPVSSMIDGGNVTIRSTGLANGKKKAIVASFRRTGFLDFIYFTDLENQDPTYLDLTALGQTQSRSGTAPGYTGQTYRQWAADFCDRYRWGPAGRGSGQWTGQFKTGPGANDWSGNVTLDTRDACGEITFGTNDQVNGPFHSNDDIQVCGSPEFGRTTNNDKVEIQGDDWHSNCGSSNPVFRPSLTKHASRLDLPPSNASIQQVADPAFQFNGLTTLKLDGANVTVQNAQRNGGAQYTTALPANGVIYVKNISCTYGYKPDDTENQDPNCGTARISGNYNRDLTIATQDDIIVDDTVKRTTDSSSAVLGLVADNFIRVWHPVNKDSNGNCTGNRSDTPKDVRIDAAILSLKHSFTVDNYNCGSSLGTLNVNGVIAQKHRGIVATGSGGTGYLKNYVYDDRLKYRAPPYFLDPVQSSWRILRQSEQSPAR